MNGLAVKLLEAARKLAEAAELTFKTESKDDSITIEGYDDGKLVGKVTFAAVVDAYEYFENDFSEEEYDELCPDNELIHLEHLQVNDAFKGLGFGRELMQECMKQVKATGVKTVYLNASPMGPRGLPLGQLVKFYESFGFIPLLEQGNNTQMILKL